MDTAFPVSHTLLMVRALWRFPSGRWRFPSARATLSAAADSGENARAAGLSRVDGPVPGTAIRLASAPIIGKFALFHLSVIALVLVFMRTRQA